MLLLVVVTLGGAWWYAGGSPLDHVGDVLGQTQPAPPPPADVVALADAAHLSDEGRQIFYGTRPEVLDATAFAGRCTDAGVSSRLSTDHAVGCYQPGPDTIVIYRPADPRLAGQAVTTAGHETLHAAWARLAPAEQATLAPLLESAASAIPADDEIHEQIAGSVGTHPETRPTELFAYLGTQVDGLDPVLERRTRRFVADRPALVASYIGLQAFFDQMNSDVQASSQALVAVESTNARDRGQLTADVASRDYYRSAYQTKVDEVAAMSEGQRARLRLSWAVVGRHRPADGARRRDARRSGSAARPRRRRAARARRGDHRGRGRSGGGADAHRRARR